MVNLQALDTEELLDMLSQHNENYARLMLAGTKEEFEECKSMINKIQQELNLRKQAENN